MKVAASKTQPDDRPANLAAARWPAVIALFAVGGLYVALPERLTVGPSWLLLVVVGILVIPATAAHKAGLSKLNTVLGTLLSAIVTLAMVWSLAMLIAGLPGKRESPTELLRAAVALWLSNVLVFASWYWRLDAGGPHRREARRLHTDGAFLFPQMTLPANMASSYKTWQPDFIDYLFLAFNTSTAFSPTDVPVLSALGQGPHDDSKRHFSGYNSDPRGAGY